jgi:ketosteroid isomerase-like protein
MWRQGNSSDFVRRAIPARMIFSRPSGVENFALSSSAFAARMWSQRGSCANPKPLSSKFLFPQGGPMYRNASSVLSASHVPDVESTIRGLTQDFCTAFNTGNYDQAAALFASSGVLMPARHELAEGPKAIERVLREYGDAGYQDLRLETTRVEYSGDIAIEIGKYSVVIRQENGTISNEPGKYLHAWRRLGIWLMTADCWNTNLPPLK